MSFDAIKLYLAIGILVVWGAICFVGGWKSEGYFNGKTLAETKLECTAKDLQAANDALAGEKAARKAEADERAEQKKQDDDIHKTVDAALADYRLKNEALQKQLTQQQDTIQQLREGNKNVKAQLDTPYDPSIVAGLRQQQEQGSAGPTAPAAHRDGGKAPVHPARPKPASALRPSHAADDRYGQPWLDYQRLAAGQLGAH